MPLSLPAHAAAALPLYAMAPRFLNATALVVGCCAPDLAFVVGLGGADPHTASSLLTICLPVGLIWFVWAEVLALPFLSGTAPAGLGVDWPRLFRPTGLPRSFRGVLAVIVSVLLGAGSHILWDGLAHPGWWPARELYPETRVTLLGQDVHPAQLVWAGSTLLGTAVVLVYLWVRFRGPVAIRGGSLRWFIAAAAAVTASCAAAIVAHQGASIGSATAWDDRVMAAVLAVRLASTCGLAAFTLVGLAYRIDSRRTHPSP